MTIKLQVPKTYLYCKNIPVNNFSPYLGTYREAKTGAGINLFTEDNSLYLQPHTKLIPTSNNSATMGRARWVFAKGTALLISGADTTVYTTTPPTDLNDLKKYAGIFGSDETESKMDIVWKEGKLFMEQREEKTLLTPVYKDGFSFPGGDLFFEPDTKGNIRKVFISIPRARKVEFSKLN